MSEQETSFQDDRAVTQDYKRENRERAAGSYEEARKIAESHGLTLDRSSQFHYVLRYEHRWMVDIYPGNQRIYNPPERAGWPERGPYIDVGACEGWTLVDVVGAAVERLGS